MWAIALEVLRAYLYGIQRQVNLGLGRQYSEVVGGAISNLDLLKGRNYPIV